MFGALSSICRSALDDKIAIERCKTDIHTLIESVYKMATHTKYSP